MNYNKAYTGNFGIPVNHRPRSCSVLWHEPAIAWEAQLREALEASVGKPHVAVFFRADDIGIGGRAFHALCELFRSFEVPLALGVIPSWLSKGRQQLLFESASLSETLWGWHQHGWRHINWEPTGKKSEFGDHRALEKQRRDIQKGQIKLKGIFGQYMLPVFTPPWNRISHATLDVLDELGFKAISTADPAPPGIEASLHLINLKVNLDLHTRKGTDPGSDYRLLLHELSTLLAGNEPLGIMIHHQRMTSFAFQFLFKLLYLLKEILHSQFLSFEEMLKKPNEH